MVPESRGCLTTGLLLLFLRYGTPAWAEGEGRTVHLLVFVSKSECDLTALFCYALLFCGFCKGKKQHNRKMIVVAHSYEQEAPQTESRPYKTATTSGTAVKANAVSQ